jgi:hypothetical protein
VGGRSLGKLAVGNILVKCVILWVVYTWLHAQYKGYFYVEKSCTERTRV